VFFRNDLSRYEGSLVPCCSLAVVHMKPTEARVEAVLDDFMALKQIGNVYDKEVAHGNMGSDDDGGSEGIVLTDEEDSDARAGAPKSQKEAKVKKSPSASSSSKGKSSSKSSSKSKPSKSKPKKTKTKSQKPGKKTPAKKAATPAKSVTVVRCTQPPPRPFAVIAVVAASAWFTLFAETKHARKERRKTRQKENQETQQQQQQQRQQQRRQQRQ
jgi:hypothetical protein